MPDPEGELPPPEPAGAESGGSEPVQTEPVPREPGPRKPAQLAQSPAAAQAGRAAYLPFGAYAPPSVLAPAPPTGRTYELPSARQVVNAGLQLAQGSSRPIRRASVYIGLLFLGAFGPAAILILVGIARLLSDPATSATLTSDNPFLVLIDQPDLSGPLTLVYAVGVVGAILLIAISIDAEAMAIATLGGIASGQPLTLEQSVRRARQTFWRLFWSGALVAVCSSVVSLAIAWPFLRPLDSNQGLQFIASMIATLAVTPFAFAATGIVLGDAGAIETLRRSYRLFRARPRIALVVTLFTLVTAAIQTFAFGAGADLASRVAEFFHIGEGATSLILPGILVLAFIVAFGSLTFTIAAIVGAPQVAAFLGLTFYSGGLDKARAPLVPGKVRWVSIPMSIVMVVLGVVALAGIPMIASFHARPASLVMSFLREAADSHDALILPSGSPLVVIDPTGDAGSTAAGEADIQAADLAGLETIPRWLPDEVFDCGNAQVACGDQVGEGSITLDEGAVVFAQRVAAPPSYEQGAAHAEWGQLLRVIGRGAAPARAGPQYEGANVRFATTLDAGKLRLREFVYEDGAWSNSFTAARSTWRDSLLITVVPLFDLPDEPTAWDVYAFAAGGGAPDNIRDANDQVIEIDRLPWIKIFDPGAS